MRGCKDGRESQRDETLTRVETATSGVTVLFVPEKRWMQERL